MAINGGKTIVGILFTVFLLNFATKKITTLKNLSKIKYCIEGKNREINSYHYKVP